ncbi:hypothetical protein COT97_00360 [Candidatus Falkowbacteria bacterium CG10_big_fil_rev_8_21_14_0_10_39_11]|uniref:Cell division protein FtsQ/DivIB C-terminal domain-containing protein n=1 Tax=Candidatus Falkowbacteria bacterium CG10_big_fil_rev_8_21_14_0_10_39_11 TaxID=1974565 RepID=A0A2H0V8B9_9BACT|nr:MAG: hypothetical protein COT97_00360 [Candidatus Falkowbacteria bacterium CG10_big_fil_rev_8_21_14_0_10_39_11]
MVSYLKKDYKDLELANPRKLKEAGQKKRKMFRFLLIAISVGMVFFIYWLFFSPQFQIREINIGGINKISQEKFDNIVNEYRYSRKYYIFPRNNLLIFSGDGLRGRIGESYLLQKIDIYKDYPGYLEIWVEEKDSNIVWLTDDYCFHLDQEGVAIETCDSASRSNIIKIKDVSNNAVLISRGVVQAETLDKMIRAKEALSEFVTPDVFHYQDDGPFSLRVTTDQTFDIYLNLEEGIEAQVQRLKLLLTQDKIQQDLPQIKYFDLRFGKKIYYQ